MANAAIDMWAPIVPAREVMAHVADHFPRRSSATCGSSGRGEPTLEGFRARAAARRRDARTSIAALDARRHRAR